MKKEIKSGVLDSEDDDEDLDHYENDGFVVDNVEDEDLVGEKLKKKKKKKKIVKE